MKKNLFKYLIIIMITGMSASCVDYLNKSPEITLSENDIFSKYISYQGFVEDIYQNVVDITLGTEAEMNWNFGDDVKVTYNDMLGNYIEKGDYWKWTHVKQSPYYGVLTSTNGNKRKGYWHNGWFGIRNANIALSHLNDLVGTQEERDVIEGQCLFFRAYFHWEILRAWGGIPYIDTVYAASDVLREPRLTYLQTANRITADLQRAASLLPASWDETSVGQATLGKNSVYITKGAAYGYLGMNLLYAASPLMNGVETGNYVYNEELCRQAATAFYEVIKLADQGYHKLETWANYSNLFYSMNGVLPNANKEILFSNPVYMNKRSNYGEWLLPAMGGIGCYGAVTANYVDLFGMKNGLPINAENSGYNPSNPWVDRDPRFYYNILKDGDRIVQDFNNADTYAEFYVNGRHVKARDSDVSFGHKKFYHITCNKFDNKWTNNFYYEAPHLRLAEIYLNYAEAVNEAYGPKGNIPGGLTAVAALNIVRARAGVPGVDARYLNSKDDFREIVRQERAVELAFEGHRWNDIRRWHVAHLPQFKEKYYLEFDKGHTYFKKYLYATSIFEEKHYWLPFEVNQVTLYSDFQQNPGW